MASARLLDQVREQIRVRHYSYRTEQAYVAWVKRFVLFHNKRHPKELGGPEVAAFLSYLAVSCCVSAATQSQALAALLFLYRHVLNADLPWLDSVVRASKPRRLPVVLTDGEARAVIGHLRGELWLIGSLLYGSGLRLLEALRLRVKDVDLDYRQLLIRDGKGAKDRATVLAEAMVEPLRVHLQRTQEQHRLAVEAGYGGVELPLALARKYPGAHLQWGWQYVFPASTPSADPRSGVRRRHHVHEKSVQRAVHAAVRAAGIMKPASPHTFRHSFATHLLERGYDIRTVQELMGHKDVTNPRLWLQRSKAWASPTTS
jgi:integron integrase